MLQSENKYMQVLYIINKKRLVNIPPHPPQDVQDPKYTCSGKTSSQM